MNLPHQGPAIFAPNHPNGLLDPILLFFLSPPFRLRFVAKAPLFKIPVFGAILRSIGAIPVMRKFEATGNVDYTAFFAACVDALIKGDCIVIFPEGRSLPQAYLAPLKTGPARLCLMAHQKGVKVPIVPVGLNYEKGTTFRSRVLMRIAAPFLPEWSEDQNESAVVREWTAELAERLQESVIQAESYRDRELMLLLERLSASEEELSEPVRFERLKQFEQGLSKLRTTAASEIDGLRKLLTRFERLTEEYGVAENASHRSISLRKLVLVIGGAILAFPGWILNLIPYFLCDWLIKFSKRDASDIATFKVVYSLFLFPLFYATQAYLIHRLFGPIATVLFLLFIFPCTYFTLFYMEWYESDVGGLFWPSSRQRMKAQLERLRARILGRLNALTRQVQS